MTTTIPGDTANDHTPAVTIQATYKDPRTGALYVHEDLHQAQAAWDEEAHIGPPKAAEAFGDVESWARYVKRFSGAPDFPPFVSWNSGGLRAVLDYHDHADQPGRMQWTAAQPFELSPEWKSWMALVNAGAIAQRAAIERLEDRGAEIVDPPQADLMNLLRNLRATVNATAQAELLPDGTTRVGFTQDKQVKGIGNDLSIPPEFSIAIPVLKGHPDVYKLTVKLRVSIDDNAHLTLRFAIPNAERALEQVYADRVKAATDALGAGFDVLRAAG